MWCAARKQQTPSHLLAEHGAQTERSSGRRRGGANSRARGEDHGPAGPAQPVAEVYLLAEHEVALVEARAWRRRRLGARGRTAPGGIPQMSSSRSAARTRLRIRRTRSEARESGPKSAQEQGLRSSIRHGVGNPRTERWKASRRRSAASVRRRPHRPVFAPLSATSRSMPSSTGHASELSNSTYPASARGVDACCCSPPAVTEVFFSGSISGTRGKRSRTSSCELLVEALSTTIVG